MKRIRGFTAAALLVLATSVLLNGCAQNVDISAAKESMMEADRQFSALSAAEGVGTAFSAYMTDNATTFVDKMHPISGRVELEKRYSNAKGVTLVWNPTHAEISSSGDFGYTRGRWDRTFKNADGTAGKAYGYYITVWQKQPDKSWKWIFDTGITGPDEEIRLP